MAAPLGVLSRPPDPAHDGGVTIALASLPLRLGSSGPDVADLQRRLLAAGYDTGGEAGEYLDGTREAVRSFQSDVGLDPDGECDESTWSALVEASFRLGTRLVCLRSPMMRGDDVAELQLRLGALGFDAGRVDGIFGPITQTAVGDFQRNAGLVADEVCGPETVAALRRLEGRAGSVPVSGVRERDQLRRRFNGGPPVGGLRVALGVRRDADPLVAAVAASLQQSGAVTLLLSADWSEQAAATNDFGADVYLGFALSDEPVLSAAYFSVPGYESGGGRRLAELVVEEFPAAPGWTVGAVRGMRLPILRETRPPAVLIKVGDLEQVDRNRSLVVASLVRTLQAWAGDPC